jgi:ferric-dicitrate binding protein FerR (iron transport regulator)
MSINPEADYADHLIAQCRRELVRHPRSPVAMTKQTAKDIDLSGIFRMSADEIDQALRALEAA